MQHWWFGYAVASESQNEVETTYVASDDILPGQKRINGNGIIARNNRWVPIKSEEASIYINKFKTTSPAIRVGFYLCCHGHVQFIK